MAETERPSNNKVDLIVLRSSVVRKSRLSFTAKRCCKTQRSHNGNNSGAESSNKPGHGLSNSDARTEIAPSGRINRKNGSPHQFLIEQGKTKCSTMTVGEDGLSCKHALLSKQIKHVFQANACAVPIESATGSIFDLNIDKKGQSSRFPVTFGAATAYRTCHVVSSNGKPVCTDFSSTIAGRLL